LRTYIPKSTEIERKWYVVDASSMVLGRLASHIAAVIRGKNKPSFTPHLDVGDFVVVVNAEKVLLTGKKADIKTYSHYTGYPGGLKQEIFSSLLRRRPERIIEFAVWGMLPHTRLGKKQFKKLKVYRGEQHPHQAQKPETLTFKSNRLHAA
jgi:large subunit ribosomal protein L13